jgi:predicted RNA-binding protein YlxR (DUF448 family)
LLRVVAVTGAGLERSGREAGSASLAVDPRHRLPGRGAYLHVDQACLAKAEQRRAFTRALRVAGILDTGELAAYVAEQTARTSATAGATGTTDGGKVHPDSKVGRPNMSTR